MKKDFCRHSQKKPFSRGRRSKAGLKPTAQDEVTVVTTVRLCYPA